MTAAVAYDVEQAAKRSEYLDQQRRAQVEEDVQTLTAVIRGMMSLSALILNSYLGQDGTLCRSADVRDAVAMVRIALAGVPLLHAQGQPAGPSRADIDQIVR
jgi:hypothetical protein